MHCVGLTSVPGQAQPNTLGTQYSLSTNYSRASSQCPRWNYTFHRRSWRSSRCLPGRAVKTLYMLWDWLGYMTHSGFITTSVTSCVVWTFRDISGRQFLNLLDQRQQLFTSATTGRLTEWCHFPFEWEADDWLCFISYLCVFHHFYIYI